MPQTTRRSRTSRSHHPIGRITCCLDTCRVYFTVLLVIISSLSFAQTSPHLLFAQEAAYLTAGDSAYAAFDNISALSLYKKAFALDQSSFQCRIRLSRTHYDYGLDLLARNAPDSARTHFKEAITHADFLVTTYPDSAESHFMLAATTGNLAQFESGKQKLEIGRVVEQHSRVAIELDSTFAYPYVSLGIYYREITQLKWIEKTLARMFYGKVPDTSPQDVIDMLLYAAQLRPHFPFLQFELAMTYMLYNQPQKALHHLQQLVALPPENSQDIRNQQNALSMIKDLQK